MIVAAVAAALAPTTADGAIRAGAASADLTPPVGTPMFAYTARSGLANPGNLDDVAIQLIGDPDQGSAATSFIASRGIHTRVRARAIVLEAPAGKFALVQVDLGGIPYDLTRAVLDRLAGTGITADRLLISATHTHSSTGPIWPNGSGGYALLGGDFFDAHVFNLTADGIAEAIRAADTKLAPARIGVASTNLRGASRNRNYEPFERNKDIPDDPEARKAYSVNPALNVIRVDAMNGNPIGVWSNFAIHQTSFGDDNLLFTGDNASYTERIVERALGRGAVNVFTNSAEGDISPNGGPDGPEDDPRQYVDSAFASAHMAGRRVARGVLRAWRKAGRAMRADLPLDSRRIFLEFDGTEADGEPVGPIPVLGVGIVSESTCAPFDGFAGPGQGMKMPALAGVGLVPSTAPVSVWRIGPLALPAFSTEITVQMGRRIAGAVKSAGGGAFERVAVVGLTNAYQSYTSTPEEYDACAYEGSFTLWGRRQGPRLRDVAVSLAKALIGGEPPESAGPPPSSVPAEEPGSPPDPTPNAGTVDEEPDGTIRRPGRATFSWQGGNPQLDAPRGETFVSLQRRQRGRFVTVATDDSYADTVERDDDGIWTETYQFEPCSPTGTYRFRVTGRADKGEGAAPYVVESRSFRVRKLKGLVVEKPVLKGRRLTLRATYPDPGEDALLALPRRVRTGRALLRVRGVGRVRALPNPSGVYRARLPKSAEFRVLEVKDRCGNTGR